MDANSPPIGYLESQEQIKYQRQSSVTRPRRRKLGNQQPQDLIMPDLVLEPRRESNLGQGNHLRNR